jgi:PTH1 family peptidyl-tRNA hydrolase
VWLVVGLGNPGAKYARNRHNIGFQVVDELVAKHGLPAWKSGKLGGDTTAGVVTTERGRERCVVLKPMEYMNLSGFVVQRTADFHGVEPPSILVVHDEIDLELGMVRLKSGGGHGGHNGLRSITEQLGGGVRLVEGGVGRDPGHQAPTAGGGRRVLSGLPDQAAVTAMIQAGCEISRPCWGGIGLAMTANAR